VGGSRSGPGVMGLCEHGVVAALAGLLSVLVTAVGLGVAYLQRTQSDARLRLDAAMRAADLFEVKDDASPNPASSASGLLALTRLGHAELAVALLVDLWSQDPPDPLPAEEDTQTPAIEAEPAEPNLSSEAASVSNETAMDM
jgi:hypothetical protein